MSLKELDFSMRRKSSRTIESRSEIAGVKGIEGIAHVLSHATNNEMQAQINRFTDWNLLIS
jgi:hypothetical protein